MWVNYKGVVWVRVRVSGGTLAALARHEGSGAISDYKFGHTDLVCSLWKLCFFLLVLNNSFHLPLPSSCIAGHFTQSIYLHLPDSSSLHCPLLIVCLSSLAPPHPPPHKNNPSFHYRCPKITRNSHSAHKNI